MRIGWSGWSVEVSDEWTVTDHPECLTLELSGEAALQLSSARKKSGYVTDAELRDIVAEHDENWGLTKPTWCGEFRGLVVNYTKDGDCWSRWFLRNGATLLFATYNGPPEVAMRESSAILQLLSSAKADAASAA